MRFFLEVSYKGTAYSGFQTQQNAITIQSEVEKALSILQKEVIILTGSSRTDAGVHALQNFFHFDSAKALHEHFRYKMNAILPPDIVIRNATQMPDDAHSRFDASYREYKYYIYRHKDPFLEDRAFYFPYKLDRTILDYAANLLMEYEDFTSFSKRNTQVKTFHCKISESKWIEEDGCLVYQVKSNRFLRGMVRALVATMLKAGRGKITLEEFRSIIEAKDCTKASFSVPPQGLFLISVNYPDGYFEQKAKG